ncbi:glycosyltransferase [Gammaproteobacteria bacterium]|nr:glycosyltransferase [Gammaproteobacteria bacterium]
MVSLILPTLNEEQNLVILLPKIQSILTNLQYEIIIVDDDSDDQTREIAETYFQEHKNGFVHHRKKDLGLSASIYVTAVIFGAAVNYKIHLSITWKRLGQYITKPWKR